MSEFNVKGTSTSQRQKDTEESHGHHEADAHDASSAGPQDHSRVHHHGHQDKGGSDQGDSHFNGRVERHETHSYVATHETEQAAAGSKYGEGFEGLEKGQEGREARAQGSKSASNTGWRNDASEASADAKAGDSAQGDNDSGYSVPTFAASQRVKDSVKHPDVQAAGKDFHSKVSAGDKDANEVVEGLASGEPKAMAKAQNFMAKSYAATPSSTSSSKLSVGSSHDADHAAREADQKKANARFAASMTDDGTDDMASKQKQSKGGKAAGKGGSKAATGGAGGGKGDAGAAAGASGGEGAKDAGGGGGGDGLDGLSGMELVQAVMLAAASEAAKSAQDLAKQVQGNTARKNALRAEMEPMRAQVAGQSQTNADGTGNIAAQQSKVALDNKQDQMDAIGDDNQILFIKLQNATQQYSSMLQGCSNVSKTLFDIDKAVIGNIGH